MGFRLSLNEVKARRRNEASLQLAYRDLWIYRHSWLGSTWFEISSWFVCLCVYLVPSMTVLGVWLPGGSAVSCLDRQADVLIGFLAFCLIVIIFMTIRLWNRDDAFYIKAELRTASSFGVVFFVAWVATFISQDGYDPVVVFIGLFVTNIVVLHYPVFMVLYTERIYRQSSEKEELDSNMSADSGGEVEREKPVFEAGSAKFLQYCLHDSEVLRQCFEVFAIKNFQVDIFHLYLDVSAYRKVKDEFERKSLAKTIKEEYLTDTSPSRVRFDSGTEGEVLKSIEAVRVPKQNTR